jgi:protein phosphatase PTC2/3
VKDPAFIEKPPEAIKQGFARAEQLIIDLAQRQPNGVLEKSGSCAVVLFVVGKMCYIANVGDSRAIMSCEEGEMLYELSIDHKPTDPHEQLRVVSGGGKIYQTKISNPNFNPGEPRFVLGPYRVLPGRLSVTRTFGDAEAKLVKYGGNPNVVIARPEIKYFEVGPEVDFILLCSDGVFDKATSQEIIQLVWEVART